MLTKLLGMVKPATPQKRMWRQGDVFVIEVPQTAGADKIPQPPILARGEVTGHAHRIAEMAAAMVYRIAAKPQNRRNAFGLTDDTFLEVTADSATLVHEEHGPIEIPRGNYVVRIQREYTPQQIVRVVD
ncbi:MAG: hypothetical protein ACAI35_02240 [Candidatus Methylacidiphilales bacterium]|nr:hypothetical protein [Candidatus Methylacidiphilales bacterium]